MKRIVAYILILSMLLAIMPLTVLAVDTSGIYYILSEDETYYIASCNDKTITKAIISSSYDGKPVKEIVECAFLGCSNLISVNIPETVTYVGFLAFSGCDSLEKITVEQENNVYHSAGNCLIKTQTNTLVWGCKTSVIPSDGSVTKIDSYAFESCTGLTSITIPDSIILIGEFAFDSCQNLKSIIIPNSVKNMGECVFSSCKNLKNIFCEEKSQPSGWNSDWKGNCDALVYWGYNPDCFAGGDGTEANPYLIATKEHLNNARNCLGSHFKMIADIEFSDSDFAEGGAFYNDGKGFEPIGLDNWDAFSGTFDGDGHVIKNIYINIESAESNSTVYAGLFGYNKGTVENLGMVDGSVTGSVTASTTGNFCYAHAGGIAGYNTGTIENCYNTGSVSATSKDYAHAGGIAGCNEGTITNCYNTGSVSGKNVRAGGIAGYNSRTIENCYNTGNVSGGSAGGIAGRNYEGTIKNCYNTGNISGGSAGGIAGLNCGAIKNCYNTGNVSGGYAGGIAGSNGNDDYSATIVNCYNTGDVSATSEDDATAGGIAGGNEGTITNCYNTGDVQANSSSFSFYSSDAGGIAGYNHGTIKNCYNTGNVSATSEDYAHAGGIAGANSGTIENCYNTGNVSATAYSAYAGGIAGYNTGTIKNCYYSYYTPQGVGSGNDTTTKCTFEQLKQQTTFVGFDFDTVWTFDETPDSYPFPILRDVQHIEGTENTTEFAGGNGSFFKPFLVSNKTQLNNVRNYLGAHFKMIADIEFSESDFAEGGAFYNDGKGFEPIGLDVLDAFSGTFDGDGHVIKNIYINVESSEDVYAGLFGYNKGTVENLGMVDGNVYSDSNNDGVNAYAGGIAGKNYGTIENCYNTGSVSATSDYSAYAGGIAGYNFETITNCYNTGSVSGEYAGGIVGGNEGTITNCYNTGSVTATTAGGIAGYNDETIKNCYNTGIVTASATGDYNYAYAGGIAGSNGNEYTYIATIDNCYNTGIVTASATGDYNYAYAGGIAGANGDYGTIKNCYYSYYTPQGVGSGNDTTTRCTFEQLKQQTTFVGFDFDTVWTFDETNENHPYPVLIGMEHIESENENAKFDVIINAPTCYVAGEEITVTVTVENITTEKGLSYVSFDLNYLDALTLTNVIDEDSGSLDCVVKMPDGWENLTSVSDSTVSVNLSTTKTSSYATENGDITLEFTFMVAENSTSLQSIYIPSESVRGGVFGTDVEEFEGNGTEKKITPHFSSEEDDCEKDTLCSICGEILVPSKGHTGGEFITVLEPDLGVEGWREQYCTECGKLVASEPIDALMLGDVDGNGKIVTADYICAKRYVMQTLTLTDAQIRASDVNGDGTLTIGDYVIIKRHVMGAYVIGG